jgi:hypothetical protein
MHFRDPVDFLTDACDRFALNCIVATETMSAGGCPGGIVKACKALKNVPARPDASSHEMDETTYAKVSNAN